MKTLTLKNIAKKVGVSTSTVSRVLNGTPSRIPVSEKTKRKVHKLVKELDYHPDVYARSLRSRKSYTVGVVIEDVEDPYFGPVIRAIEETLIPRDYHFLVTNARNEGKRELVCVDYLLSRLVEGIIFAGTPEGYNDEAIKKVTKKGIPCVLLKRKSGMRLPSITINNENGGYIATQHLLKLGHQRIAFLSGPAHKSDSQNRLKGYKKALREFGIGSQEKLIEKGNHTPESGYKMMKRLLKKCPETTACFAYDDLVALGAMKAIQEEGKRIPEDFSIVGFDDNLPVQYPYPPLTTVRQPVREMGGRAVNLLLDSILSGGKKPAETVVFPLKLIIRQTTKKRIKTNCPPIGGFSRDVLKHPVNIDKL